MRALRPFLGLIFLVLMIARPALAAQTTNFFNENLSYGSRGLSVTALQNFLTSEGIYSGPISGNFYSLTLKAVEIFQQRNGITPASGYFGPLSRAQANILLSTASFQSTSTTSSLEGAIQSTNQTTTVAVTPAIVLTTATTTNSGLQWGAYVGDSTNDAATFESEVGAKMDMQAIFVGWGNDNGPFPSQYASTVANQGKTLVIFWEPSDGSSSLNQPNYNYDSITSGTWDSYFTTFSAAAKAYGGPVILVPFAEMNGDWDPWDGTVNGNSPASFIAAWQHVRGFFSNDPNVKFAWDVNSDSEPSTSNNSISSYYPGSAYVDYVGVDVFNFGNPWESFSQIASSALTQLEKYHKPIYIFSMASEPGSQKAAWITDALTIQIPSIPNVAGWIWFNDNKEENWLVNSDSNSLTAFEQAIPK